MVETTQTTHDSPANSVLSYAADNDLSASDAAALADSLNPSLGSLAGALGGYVTDPDSFARAVKSFVKSDDRMTYAKTEYYDFNFGDSGQHSPINRWDCAKNDDREIVASEIVLETEEEVGRFVALIENLGWALEWGIAQNPRNLEVVVSASGTFDFDR